MTILDFLRRKKGADEVKVKRTPEQISNITQVKARHQHRIDNLLDEAQTLSNKLTIIEEDENMQKSLKTKTSDMIVQRLTLIKYEVGIRENLISWL